MRSTTIIAVTLFAAAISVCAAPIAAKRDVAVNPYADLLEQMKVTDVNDPASLAKLQTSFAALNDDQKELLASIASSAASAHDVVQSLDPRDRTAFEEWFVQNLSEPQEAYFIQQLTGSTDKSVITAAGQNGGALSEEFSKQYFALPDDERRMLIEYALTLGTTPEQSDKIDEALVKAAQNGHQTEATAASEEPEVESVEEDAEPTTEETNEPTEVAAETTDEAEATSGDADPVAQEAEPTVEEAEPVEAQSTVDAAEPVSEPVAEPEVEALTAETAADGPADAEMAEFEAQAQMIEQYLQCIDAATARDLVKQMQTEGIEQAAVDSVKENIPSLVAEAAGQPWTAPAECPAIPAADAPAAKRSLADLD